MPEPLILAKEAIQHRIEAWLDAEAEAAEAEVEPKELKKVPLALFAANTEPPEKARKAQGKKMKFLQTEWLGDEWLVTDWCMFRRCEHAQI